MEGLDRTSDPQRGRQRDMAIRFTERSTPVPGGNVVTFLPPGADEVEHWFLCNDTNVGFDFPIGQGMTHREAVAWHLESQDRNDDLDPWDCLSTDDFVMITGGSEFRMRL